VIWYAVRDLAAARDFYTTTLGFEEIGYDEGEGLLRLSRDDVDVAVTRGDGGETEAVAQVEVEDVKAEADRLRSAGVDVGVVLELPGTIRLVDVFDPDGNRLQLTQDL
jgi:catechol 2,3-dioxygenase-like lactoylglutathione lyase family enzyme